MADLEDKLRYKKVLLGTYEYSNNGNVYAEERFQVFKDQKNYDHIFVAEVNCRTTTGELLKIISHYELSKNWIPHDVRVERSLGPKKSEEIYAFEPKNNSIHYTLHTNEVRGESHFATVPRFHVAAPCAAASMLFILSKRFDNTARNDYTVWSSTNQWKYLNPPTMHTVSLDRVSVGNETLFINNQELSCIKYLAYNTSHAGSEELPFDYRNQQAPLTVYLSGHMAIPYIIEGQGSTRIQIKVLQDLAADE